MSKSGRCRVRRLAIAAGVAAVGVSAPAAAQTAQGLVAAAGDWLWPQLQARITIQTATLAPVGLMSLGDAGATAVRNVHGGSLLGDYIFAQPTFGSFRATSGLLLGSPGGAPMLSAAPMARLGVTVLDLGSLGGGPAEGTATLPYLGMGYSSPLWWRSLSVSADVGLVAGRPAGLSGLGRAMLGSQGMDAAVRELRLAPVLQLGLRYSF